MAKKQINRGEDFAPVLWSMKGMKSPLGQTPKQMPHKMTPQQKQNFNRKRIATAADRVMSGNQIKGRVNKSKK